MSVGLAWHQDKEFTPAIRAIYDYFREVYLTPEQHVQRKG